MTKIKVRATIRYRRGGMSSRRFESCRGHAFTRHFPKACKPRAITSTKRAGQAPLRGPATTPARESPARPPIRESPSPQAARGSSHRGGGCLAQTDAAETLPPAGYVSPRFFSEKIPRVFLLLTQRFRHQKSKMFGLCGYPVKSVIARAENRPRLGASAAILSPGAQRNSRGRRCDPPTLVAMAALAATVGGHSLRPGRGMGAASPAATADGGGRVDS